MCRVQCSCASFFRSCEKWGKAWGTACRAETAIIAALLHDTLDDTHVTLEELHEAFGPQVATCVENVSRLSMVNQMLRRHLRQQVHAGLL